MGGIVGFNFENKDLIKKMCDSMSHRGEEHGFYTDKFFSIGSRRLKILDANKGKQPISNEDKTLWIVFDGEVYNFLDIKDELEKRGHTFNTNTDTELVVHAYQEYKEDCVKLFRGMFAFCIYDLNERKLFLARDRIGKKPLFYSFKDGRFVFASELKALLCDEDLSKEISLEGLYHYFSFGYVPTPLTILEDVKKLEPGSYLMFKENDISIEKYWDINFNEIKSSRDYFANRVFEILKDSIKIRLNENSTGVLINGQNSGVITGLTKKLTPNVKTFSINHNEEQAKYAKLISEKFETDHKEINFDFDVLKDMPLIVKQLGEPIVNISFSDYYLYNFARKDVKFVLSDNGGSELFSLNDINLNNKTSFLDKLRMSFFPRPQINRIELLKNKLFDKEEKDQLLKKTDFPESSDIHNYYLKRCNSNRANKKIYLNLKTSFVENNLVNLDRLSMANSLEVRCPFLDTYVMDLTNSIPASFKSQILRKAFSSLLSSDIEEQSSKIKVKDLNFLKDSIAGDIKARDYFKTDYVKKILDDFNINKTRNQNKVFALFVFELWNKIYVDETALNKINI